MDTSRVRTALAALLDAVDRRSPDRLERIARRPREGPLFEVFERHGLDDLDVLLVLVALAGRLAGNGCLTGEDLARGAADSSAERLAALSRLDGTAATVRAGFLVPEVVPTHPADAAPTGFRLGGHCYRLACEVFGRPLPEDGPPALGPYRSNAEALGDLRRLSLHYRRRAARLFHLDPWTGTGIEVLDGTSELVRRADLARQRVADRQRATPAEAALPVLVLKNDEGLDLDSLVVLATVLFQELFEGVGAVDAVDLVKLVSESEADLLRRRTMLRPLVRKGLLRLEGAFAGKELTADASLPGPVVDRLLGEAAQIDADQRLDFHSYLEDLDSSDPFFLDMEQGGFDPPG